MLWSAGVLYSMDRAVTDLPAASLGLVAIHIGQRGGRWLMTVSSLIRETSLLSFLAVSGWRPVAKPRVWLRSIGTILLMSLPLLMWSGWVYLRFGQNPASETEIFSWPGVALWDKITGATIQLSSCTVLQISMATYQVLELAAPISLLVQSLYLLSRPKPSSTLWLYGIGFAVLFWFIGPPVWEEIGRAHV